MLLFIGVVKNKVNRVCFLSIQKKNRLLKHLDLSHNNFGDEGGRFLGQYIGSNETLESFDISWNKFQYKAAKEIAIGIKV